MIDSDKQWEDGNDKQILNLFTFKKVKNLDSSGNMSDIFLVTSVDNNQKYIVKKPKIAEIINENNDNIKSINEELKILLTIPHHQNVVECFLVDRINGLPHIFMEYVDGGDLSDWINRNKQNKEWILRINILKQIVCGMIHIHRFGLVHGDLKPSNILFQPFSEINEVIFPLIKIADFGLSKIYSELSNPNSSRIFENRNFDEFLNSGYDNSNNIFTPFYAPPEQEFWWSERIDKKSDIFSFGIVMIELITSTFYFKKEIKYYDFFPNNTKKFLSAVKEYIEEKNDDIPTGLLSIILKCLEPHPGNRYSSFEEILKDLTEINIIENIKNVQVKDLQFHYIPDSSTLIFLHALKGYSLIQLGYKDDGKIQLEKATNIEPKHIEDNINLGLCYIDLELYSKAIECFNEVLELQNEKLKIIALINKSLALAKINDYKGSIECCDEVLEKYKENASKSEMAVAYNSRGQSLSDLGNYEKAIIDFNEAQQLDPLFIYPYFNRGLALMKKNQKEEAKKAFDTTLKLDPDYYKAYYMRGIIFYENREYERAQEDFKKFLLYEPNNISAMLNYASSMIYLKQFPEFLDLAEKILLIDPHNAQISSRIIQAWSNLDKPEEELKYLNKILNVNPKNTDILIRKSFVCGHILGDFEKEIECCYEVLCVDPHNVDALNNIGISLGHLGEIEEGLKFLDCALEINPNYINALNNKGNLLCALDKYEEGIEYYDRVLKIDPIFTSSLLNKARIEEQLGDFETAISCVDKILKNDTNNIELLNRKGILLGKCGMLNEALSCFDSILKIDSTNRAAIHNKNYTLQLKNAELKL